MLLNLLKNLGKIFGIVCVFFLISGVYMLLKPTEEEKVLGQQMKMYPIGFTCSDDDGGEQVIKVDMKSQLAIYKDIFQYSTTKALYHTNEKKPFGCELLLTGDGKKSRILVYVSDDGALDLDQVHYEVSTDKDLIYKVVEKSVKKKKSNIRFKKIDEL